ncbi:ALF repeat-containing protein [Streptomyces sp. NPDC102467]|uniref:ALF repeat-containing protein n=1 Tax=Streptomyces sp. NPDC102467 TaxID=3366179 RepID=UPI0037FA300D
MRPTRIALLIVTGSLASSPLFTAPAFADGSTASSTTTVAATSDTPVDAMSEAELRAAIAAMLADEASGRGVVREASEALNGTVDGMRAFLKTGYRLAQAEDDQVAIARLLANPNISDALRAAANEALDDGSPETLRYFREVGQYEVDG